MSLMVHMRHARAARLDGKPVTCAPGIRTWCALHGVDLRKLAGDGLPIEQIEAIPDAFAQRAAALARQEAEQQIRCVNLLSAEDLAAAMDSTAGAQTIERIIRKGRRDG
jgi:hypothetical protein